MKIKIAVLFTCLAILALTGCKVENKEGDKTTVIKPEPAKKETTTTTIIDKTGGDKKDAKKY
jgi:hypothetical protein